MPICMGSTLCLKVDFNKDDTYYVFNHVDIVVAYHSATAAEWGAALGGVGGRLVSAKLEPRR